MFSGLSLRLLRERIEKRKENAEIKKGERKKNGKIVVESLRRRRTTNLLTSDCCLS